MTKDDLIKQYRDRFRDNLVGTWMPAEGSFMMMGESYKFFDDGTGFWTTESVLSGTEVLKFKWRQTQPFLVDLLVLYEDDDIDEEKEDWVRINYDFKVIENDIAKEVILCSNGSDYFYLSTCRLTFFEKLN